MREKTWPRLIYDFFIKNWFLSAAVGTAPTFWFAFVELFGKNFGLTTADGKLNDGAILILWPLFIVSLIFTLLMSLGDRYNEKAKNNGQLVLQKLLQSVNSIKQLKVRHFTEFIDKHHGTVIDNPFHEVNQPETNMNNILDKIQEIFTTIFGIEHQDAIGLSLIYKMDKTRKWKMHYKSRTNNDLSLQELIGNPNTSVRQIIDNKTSIVFFPDKRIGIERGEYVPSRKDKDNGNIGSILCKDISLETKGKYIQAILSISTYGTQLCGCGDADAINKINKILLPTFEERIRLELSLFYIKEVLTRPYKQPTQKRRNLKK